MKTITMATDITFFTADIFFASLHIIKTITGKAAISIANSHEV